MDNKVFYGLSKCAVAPITVTAGVYGYGALAQIPGAVEFKATPKGDVQAYEADNGDYVVVDKSEGYDCEAAFYGVPEEVVKKYFGQSEDAKNVAAEFAGTSFPAFAFLGQINGDVHNRRFSMMDCVMSKRIAIETKTAKSKEPNKVTVSFSARPRTSDNLVRLYTKPETDQTVYDNWFTAVQDYVASSGE